MISPTLPNSWIPYAYWPGPPHLIDTETDSQADVTLRRRLKKAMSKDG